MESIIPVGFPDIIGIVDGQVILLELKAAKPSLKLLRESQRRFIRRWSENGGEAYVVWMTSKDGIKVTDADLNPVQARFLDANHGLPFSEPGTDPCREHLQTGRRMPRLCRIRAPS